MSEPTQRLRGPLGWAARALGAAGLAAVFATAAPAALLLHLDLPLSRRVARWATERILARTFAGELRVGPVTQLSTDGLTVESFSVRTAGGEDVLAVEGIRLIGDWLDSALSLAAAGGEGTLRLPLVRLEHATVGLRLDEQGRLTLAEAFGPREPAIPEPEPPTIEPGGAGLAIEAIEIGAIDVIGQLGVVPIDAHVSRLFGRLRTGGEGLALDVDRSSVREERVLGTRSLGTVDYHLRTRPGASPAMWGTFGGHLGSLELHASAGLEDGRVAISLELPRVGSKELDPWLQDAPLAAPVSATVVLSGVPPLLDLEGKVLLPAFRGRPAGKLGIGGRLRVESDPLVDATLYAEDFNAQLFGDELPVTELDARARVHAKLAGDASELSALVESSSSRVAGEPLPPLGGTVRLARGGVEARLVADEPASPLALFVRVRDKRLSFALHADAHDLSASPRLARLLDQPLRGRARVTASGQLSGDDVDITARAQVTGLRAPAAQLSVGAASVEARVRGPRRAPTVSASATGHGLVAGGQQLQRFQLAAAGPLTAPTVRASATDAQGREARARGTLDTERRELRQVEVDVERGGARMSGRVARVRSGPAGLSFEGLALADPDGGKAEGSLRLENGELVGTLRADDVDLVPLSRLLDLPYPVRGKADLDIELYPHPEGRRGHVSLRLKNGGVLVLSGVEVELAAEFDGQRVTPRAKLRLVNEATGAADRCGGTIAEIALDDAAAELQGPLLEAATWQRFRGSTRVAARGLKLDCLAEIVDTFDPRRPLPLQRIAGVLDGSAIIERKRTDGWVSVRDLVLRTQGLVLSARPEQQDAAPAWSTDRIDLALTGAFDGESGDIEIDTRFIDASAPSAALAYLARLQAGMRLDLEALGGPREAAVDSLLRAPLTVRLVTERRAIAGWHALPVPLREGLDRIRGDVEIDAFAEGSVADPSLALRVRAWGLEPAPRDPGSGSPRTRRWSFPVDIDTLASYHDAAGRLDVTIAHRGRRIATLDGESKGNLAARLLGGHDERWTGWLRARLRGLPLGAIPPVARLGIDGRVHGEVRIDELGAAPRLSADIDAAGLTLSGEATGGRPLVLERATVRVKPVVERGGGPGLMTLESRVDAGGGTLEIAGYGTIVFDDKLFPRADTEQPAALYIKSRDFPLRSLAPLLPRDQVARADGKLSGELRLAYREILGREVALDADMRLADGVVHLPAVGQEYYGVGARVRAEGTQLVIDDIRASAEGGSLAGKLTARFAGLELSDVTGSFHVPDDRPMPIALEGVPLGTASMKQLHVHATKRTGELDVVVTVDGLDVSLPASVSREVQGLEAHPEVAISHPLERPTRRRREAPTPINLTVGIHDAEIEGESVRIEFHTAAGKPLRFKPHLEEVGGELTLTGGELVLMGRVFEIERGFVRLRDKEPDNPYVSATAHWTAPDGSTVFVDYVGPLRPISRDKLTFRSNPPRSQNELIALLLFGDSQSGARVGSVTAERRESIAAEQLSVPLGELAPGLSTSVASGSAGNTSGSLVYQLSDRITARATLESAGGGRTDTAEATDSADDARARSRTRISIDWRFAPKWLLRGTFSLGDNPASGVDMLFQHRY